MDKLLYWTKVWLVTVFGSNIILLLIISLEGYDFSSLFSGLLLFTFFTILLSAPAFIILGLLLYYLKINEERKLKLILSLLSTLGVFLSFYFFLNYNIFSDFSYIPLIYLLVMVSSIFVFKISTKPIELIIFDLDGTLLNTYKDLGNAVNHVLAKYDFPTHDLEAYKTFVGNGIDDLLQQCLPIDFTKKVDFQTIRNEFVEFYEANKFNLTEPYEGIIDLLHELNDRNIQLAVASNKYHEATVELVDKYFSEIKFKVVFGHRKNKPKKPNPTIVLDILEQTKMRADKTMFIGDSSVDMQTAINANVKSIGVTWGFRSEEELRKNGANYIITHPSEISNYFLIN